MGWKAGSSAFSVVLCVCLACESLRASSQMPDAKQMSGIPRPVTDLPNSSISVRLIRGDLSNNITEPSRSNCTPARRCRRSRPTTTAARNSTGSRPGATVKAIAVVDGERLESQEFPVPAQGGVRLMLVATDKTKGPATTPEAPAVTGQVVIGDAVAHRHRARRRDDRHLLSARHSEQRPGAGEPAGAVRVRSAGRAPATRRIMEGSSPQASVPRASACTVSGPFPPGARSSRSRTGCRSGSGIDRRRRRRFPADIEQLAVIVKKVGNTTLSSPSGGESARDAGGRGDLHRGDGRSDPGGPADCPDGQRAFRITARRREGSRSSWPCVIVVARRVGRARHGQRRRREPRRSASS